MNELKTASKRKGSYVFVMIFVLLMVGLAGWLVGWIAGSVHGQELDVVTWDIRSFSYVRNPLTGQQITDIKHVHLRAAMDATIQPYLVGGPLAPKGSRWDLLVISRGAELGTGDAQILLDYVGAWGASSNLYWCQWTTEHPAAAPILWSAVRDAVHLSHYERLPDLFETARGHSEAEELKPLIAEIMLPMMLTESKSALKAADAPRSQAIAKQGLTYGVHLELKALAEGRFEASRTENGSGPGTAGAGTLRDRGSEKVGESSGVGNADADSAEAVPK